LSERYGRSDRLPYDNVVGVIAGALVGYIAHAITHGRMPST
jgi:hypothetical protein